MKDEQRRERQSEANAARSTAVGDGAAFGVAAGTMMLGVALSDPARAATKDHNETHTVQPPAVEAPGRASTGEAGSIGPTMPGHAEPAAAPVPANGAATPDSLTHTNAAQDAPPTLDVANAIDPSVAPAPAEPAMPAAIHAGGAGASPGATATGAAGAAASEIAHSATPSGPSAMTEMLAQGHAAFDGLSSDLSQTMNALTSMTQELTSAFDATMHKLDIGLDSLMTGVSGIADSVLGRTTDMLGGLPGLSLLHDRADVDTPPDHGPIFSIPAVQDVTADGMSLLNGLSSSVLGAQRVEPADGLFAKLLGPPSDDGAADLAGALDSVAPVSLGFLGQSYLDHGDALYDGHHGATHSLTGLV